MLTKVIANIPMVKRVRIQLIPTKDNQKGFCGAPVPSFGTSPAKRRRRPHDLINRYLKETATVTLGLDVMDPIQLTVTGVDADPKAASKAPSGTVRMGGYARRHAHTNT